MIASGCWPADVGAAVNDCGDDRGRAPALVSADEHRASSDDRAEPASDELSGDDAGRSAAGVWFPSAAVEVLKPFQQWVTATSSASTAQQAMARIAQDAADISWAVASSPAAQLAEVIEKQRRKFAEIGADAARAAGGVR